MRLNYAAVAPEVTHDNQQIANITDAIALMNAWNRVAIGFHQGPEPRNKA
jgi:alkylhydroperoxidase family enzyme